ncbi:MAG TPA: SMC-Scp complex subunit ScpB [bacterium]|nr:SMC-Scp complex subunit ScpB [bacterium]
MTIHSDEHELEQHPETFDGDGQPNGHHPSVDELEPVAVADEEIAADPEDLEEVLVSDLALLQKALQAILLLEPEAITPSQVAATLGIPAEVAKRGLDNARDRLADEGIIIASGAGTYRLGTHPEVASVLEQYFQRARRRRMSRAMLETLAIVACQGPVTRAEIEAIRGVNVDSIIGRALEHEFIEVTGQKETPGRPLLYGVTDTFLRYFGLESVEELQTMLPAEWVGRPRQTLLGLEGTLSLDDTTGAAEDGDDRVGEGSEGDPKAGSD